MMNILDLIFSFGKPLLEKGKSPVHQSQNCGPVGRIQQIREHLSVRVLSASDSGFELNNEKEKILVGQRTVQLYTAGYLLN